MTVTFPFKHFSILKTNQRTHGPGKFQYIIFKIKDADTHFHTIPTFIVLRFEGFADAFVHFFENGFRIGYTMNFDYTGQQIMANHRHQSSRHSMTRAIGKCQEPLFL